VLTSEDQKELQELREKAKKEEEERQNKIQQENDNSIKLAKAKRELRGSLIDFSKIDVSKTVLGQGTYGKVYKGKFQGAPVAVKELTGTADPEEFAKEVGILSAIAHPNIIQFYGKSNKLLIQAYLAIGYSIDNKITYLVMDLASRSLHGWLQDKHTKTTHTFFCKVARQVAFAMTYLHNLKPQVLHRDLKPQNIMFNEAGDVKIVDFGLAVTKSSIASQSASERGAVGTVIYAAPEGRLFNSNT
jgi:serine/threonine protein kinase